jgi:hypothetical protein
MPWVKLDDGLYSNPKLSAAGIAATGLYARALSYCGAQLTDGFIPAKWALILADSDDDLTDILLEHELWERVSKDSRRRITRDDQSTVDVIFKADGYFIRDYLKHNPTRAEVEQGRSERSAQARRAAQQRWEKTRQQQDNHADSNAHRTTASSATRNAPGPARITKGSNEPLKPRHQCECGNDYHSAERLEQHRFMVHGIDPLKP